MIMKLSTFLAATASIASLVQGGRLEKRYSGSATYYNTETGNQGSCGGYLKNSDYVVALNSAQMSQGGWCGAQIIITGPRGNSQSATIRDTCPGCGGVGGLDLSPSLFSVFADQSQGVIQVSWYRAGAGSGNNNGGGNNDNSRTTSTYRPPSTTWHPPTTTSTTPEYTPPTTTWRPPTTSTRPTSTWTTSSSTRFSSSSVRSSSSSSSSQESSSSAASSVAANVTTIELGNGQLTTSTLAPAFSATAGIGSNANNGNNAVHGALGAVNQVVLQMANLAVNAADGNNA